MKKTVLILVLAAAALAACSKNRINIVMDMTATPTITYTSIPATPTFSRTMAQSVTNTMTPAMTATLTVTLTSTASPTATPTPTATGTGTITHSPTNAETFTITATHTITQTATITPTVLYKVDVSLIHNIVTTDRSTAWIWINENGTTPYPYATVTVDGVLIPVSGNDYGPLSNVWTYNIGQQAIISVTIGGRTATYTTPPLPGGITITADALTVSWAVQVQPGESTMIAIDKDSVQTYQAGPGITSPHPIPAATAYPTPGDYWMQVYMQNDAATDFGDPGLVMNTSVVTCYELEQYDIIK